MTRVAAALLAVMVALAAAAIGLARQYHAFLGTPLTLAPSGEVLLVPRGSSLRAVLATLEERGISRFDWRWRLCTRLNPVTILAGEYALAPGLRPADLLRLLSSGDVIRYQFTIIEGWNFSQLKAALANDAVLLQRLETLGDGKLMAHLGHESTHPEGWFLPETYQFTRGDSDLDILRRAHAAMRRALEAAWRDRDPGVPLDSPYELLILASIVEKESGQESERPDIAGVFARRLQQGWRLETDPTVIYGLGERFDGDIRTRDLRTDTPYNTYTRHGLPPTPIALPASSSLGAAARPAPGSAMFFVADGTGGHVFSDTLEAHNRAVRALQVRKP
ncbi:MAG: endolytic transglycosylase MltG [Xanthomonadales bacterium]|nr:endolytic transglycosylase MltG [Xanthomonadales bacterium]NIN59648.1 endolytic transglycosylase MltG [Xanthomonadales bacterium]NIN75061.1 endolytic transglycosylase MltG [Xanthomonadales bacterium]NIO13395.1 endolytic transglycosylase MltG [Xanthomonadales bacterium]NIP12041.1 endolytic transglycosylase MltG [Xanthomonadales bacterium]